MSIVARVHTPVTMRQVADELAVSFGSPVPALLLAQVALENRFGEAVYNYNLGNLSGYGDRDYDVALAPWATPELIAAAPASQRARYEALRQRMLKNQVPKYFRAYPHLGAGADAYWRLVTAKGYQPMLDAAERGDSAAFGAAVVSTGYCADAECGAGEAYAKAARQLARDGITEFDEPELDRTVARGVVLVGLAVAIALTIGGMRS